MTEHARLSASGSDKWLNCPASISAEIEFVKTYGERQSKFAMEGTEAHKIAECILKNETFDTWRYAGDYDYHDITKNVKIYIDYVNQYKNDSCKFFVEKRLDYDNFVKSGFGTADAVIVDVPNRVCHVFDLKYCELTKC